jgi:MFS superfamily sulfate permease-like transporter
MEAVFSAQVQAQNAVLGTSRPLSVTTSGGGPAALLSASATLSLLVGAFLLLAGLFRLGVVAIPTLILGVVMLALMLGLEHFAPKYRRHWSTVAVGIAASAF